MNIVKKLVGIPLWKIAIPFIVAAMIKMTRVYIVSEADSVMDAYEAKIKELEATISILENNHKENGK